MYDSGVLTICNLVNVAENGAMPKQVLCPQSKHWFEIRTIGMQRQYLAKGVNEQIDLLVRIRRNNNVHIGQHIVLGNGDQYRISLLTQGHDESFYTRLVTKEFYKGYNTARIVDLDYTELTLIKLEKNFEVQNDCED